jgi:hypothetical protein
MVLNDQDFTMSAANDKTLICNITKDDGSPKNLTSASAVWILSKTPMDPYLVRKTSVSGSIAITVPVSGQLQVLIYPDDTKTLAPGTYYHELGIADSSSVFQTYLTGEMVLLPSKARLS